MKMHEPNPCQFDTGLIVETCKWDGGVEYVHAWSYDQAEWDGSVNYYEFASHLVQLFLFLFVDNEFQLFGWEKRFKNLTSIKNK